MKKFLSVCLVVLAVLSLFAFDAEAQRPARDVIVIEDIATGTNAADTASGDAIFGAIEAVYLDVTGVGTQAVSLATSDGVIVYTNTALSVDTVVRPQVSATTTAGATITGVYAKIYTVGPLTLSASAGNATGINVKATTVYSSGE